MAFHSEEEIKKHIRSYLAVFVSLAVLTVVTVGVASLKLGIAAAVFVALLIASVKVSLVGAVFMHLKSEKNIIFAVLVLCAVLFGVLMAVPVLVSNDSHGKPTAAVLAAAHQTEGAHEEGQ